MRLAVWSRCGLAERASPDNAAEAQPVRLDRPLEHVAGPRELFEFERRVEQVREHHVERVGTVDVRPSCSTSRSVVNRPIGPATSLGPGGEPNA